MVLDVRTVELLADGTVTLLDDAPISLVCSESGVVRLIATGDFVVADGKLGVRVRGRPHI